MTILSPIHTESSSGRVLIHRNEIIKYGRRKLSVLRFFSASSVSAIQRVILIFFLLLCFTPHNLFQKAYSDGLSQENLPPATVGNRKASLFIKVSPPVLTTDTRGNAFIQVRLFDANNNQTIQHVTYEITITKGTSSSTGEKPLLRDFFHAHNGLLTLKIEPSIGPLQIFGDRDPFQNAWVADPGGTVNIKGPIFLEGGLYHFQVSIFGIDNDRNIFIPENAPKFDSYLSVGDVYRYNVAYQNHNYNTTLISYYDKVKNFKFDPANIGFTWSMPFDWNLSRIKQQNIFVHEEFKIPKIWKGLGDSRSFNATVNGNEISGRSLAIDPFSSKNALIVHYLLNKNEIVKLAEEIQKTQAVNSSGTRGSNNTSNMSSNSLNTPNKNTAPELMLFTLSSNALNNKSNIQTTSSDLVTDTGGIHVSASWSPLPLSPDTKSKLKINFSDAFASTSLNASVKYDLKILDKSGKVILKKENLVAKDATDTQIISFPAKEIYQLEVSIKALMRPGQTVTDVTRNGVARGIVVVPEFHSLSLLVVMVGSLAAVLLILLHSSELRVRNRF
jgi:hypothetical protein